MRPLKNAQWNMQQHLEVNNELYLGWCHNGFCFFAKSGQEAIFEKMIDKWVEKHLDHTITAAQKDS
jgi:hypothetical protein